MLANGYPLMVACNRPGIHLIEDLHCFIGLQWNFEVQLGQAVA